MTTHMQDDQLIFMVSLPRSGSTLVQKILGGHSEIYTRSEPWIMLHPLYAFKPEGIEADYNSYLAAKGASNFLDDLPVADKSYYSTKLRDCYLSLYEPYLTKNSKSRFLDKTPRYYAIFDELQNTFPNAKFIVLQRNPLAILSSILETWIKGDYDKLIDYKIDILDGVSFLQRDFARKENTYVAKYEEILESPEQEIAKIFEFLNLDNQPNCINYGLQQAERWMFGDHETIYSKSRPDSRHIDQWKDHLITPEHRQLLSDLLESIGKYAFDRMGYDFDEAQRLLLDAEQRNKVDVELPSARLSSFLASKKELLAQARTDIASLKSENITLSKRVHQLERLTKQQQSKLKDVNAQLATQNTTLTSLLKARSELLKYQALLAPIKKLRAYKRLLSALEKAKSSHRPPLQKTDL